MLSYTDVTGTPAELKTDADKNGGAGDLIKNKVIRIANAAEPTAAQLKAIDNATNQTIHFAKVTGNAAALAENATFLTLITGKAIRLQEDAANNDYATVQQYDSLLTAATGGSLSGFTKVRDTVGALKTETAKGAGSKD